jgi:lipopolysaccharide transport system ATP-binding protein
MSRPAIIIDNLSKEYRLGQRGRRVTSFREAVVAAVSSPFRRSNGKHSEETFWALKEISLEINQGEVVGIVGRNGAGKSTLLKIMSRITEPTEGCVRVRGRLASLLEIGTGFHPELTGRENIYLNGSILGMSKSEIDRKFDEIVAFAEIEKFLDTQVKHYSSGMYVRLAFAVAAHLETQILVVDEVLAVGDLAFQKKCLGRIEEVTRHGRTVLFVSHNVPAVQNLCSRCVYLERGRLKIDGDPEVVLNAYNRALAAQLSAEEHLENHPGRSSEGPPCMQWVRVTSRGPDPDFISMGNDIEVEVRFATPEPLNSVTFWVFIKNGLGIPIFGVDTDMNPPKPLQGTIQQGRVVCRIDGLPLMPGSYSIDLYLGSHNMHLDVIHDACRFEVNAADVFGNGKIPHPTSGNIFWPARWEIKCTETSDVAVECQTG